MGRTTQQMFERAAADFAARRDRPLAIETMMRIALNNRAAAQEKAARWLIWNLNVRAPMPRSQFRPTPHLSRASNPKKN